MIGLSFRALVGLPLEVRKQKIDVDIKAIEWSSEYSRERHANVIWRQT